MKPHDITDHKTITLIFTSLRISRLISCWACLSRLFDEQRIALCCCVWSWDSSQPLSSEVGCNGIFHVQTLWICSRKGDNCSQFHIRLLVLNAICTVVFNLFHLIEERTQILSMWKRIFGSNRKVGSKLSQALMPVTCICEMFIWIVAGALSIVTDVFCGFPLSLQTNARMVPQFWYGCFLPPPYQFIIHLWFSVIVSEILTAL
jgi:hypothetical protein